MDDYNVVYTLCKIHDYDEKFDRLHSLITDEDLNVEKDEFKRTSSSVSTFSSKLTLPAFNHSFNFNMMILNHLSCPDFSFTSIMDNKKQLKVLKDNSLYSMREQEKQTLKYDRQLSSRRTIERTLQRIIQGTRNGFVKSPFQL